MDVNSADKWEALYLDGSDGWDLGGPNPVFQKLLQNEKIKPGKIILLGAGRGHDAREFARHGYQVTAVDFSPSAVQEMKRLADKSAPVEIMQHDIFNLPDSMDGCFDTVLEYTCYCAIDPKRRAEFADLVARLLKPGGLYLSLAFPIGQHTDGPPFAVSVEKVLKLFKERSFKLVERKIPTDSVPSRQGREELLYLQKG
ncbi:MAG: methyltransferase domain-containing protein [Anaerolineae bacterium]|nr:methyltransferase domain-containing protein [Anaerolineae bacterium]